MKNKLTGRAMVYITITLLSIAATIFLKVVFIGYGFLSTVFLAIGALSIVFLAVYIIEQAKPKLAKNIRRAIITVMCLGLCIFAVAEIPVVLGARTDEDVEADYLIVLGAAVHGTKPSQSLINRLSAARDYLIEFPNTTVIVSGGQGDGEDITEAEAMSIWLENNGISPERIVKEDQATSTLENIAYSLNLIDELGGDPEGKVAIVSSEYHLYRGKQIAKEFGADPVGVAGRTPNPMLRTNYFMREGIAVMRNWVFGYEVKAIEA